MAVKLLKPHKDMIKNHLRGLSKDTELRKRLKSLNLSIFTINNLYYVINDFNINHITIYRAKFLGIVTLKALPKTVSIITQRK